MKKRCDWVATWGESPIETSVTVNTKTELFNDKTIRMIVHISLGGKSFRVRLSNAYVRAINLECDIQNNFVTIQKANIAIRDKNSSIVLNSIRELTFGGNTNIVIPPNSDVLSDPVKLNVSDETDLAITMYVNPPLSQTNPTQIYASNHPLSHQTSYIAQNNGDFTSNIDGSPFSIITTKTYFITSVEVLTKKNGIVCIGDSITDGARTVTNTNTRYTDFLVRRLIKNKLKHCVINAGISGNQVYYNSPIDTNTGLLLYPYGYNLLSRFDTDVLAKPGIKYIILLEGINDIGFSYGKQGNLNAFLPTSSQIIEGYSQIIQRSHEKGLKIYGGTLLPYHGSDYYSLSGENIRQEVNEWIRKSNKFDDFIDFDLALRDPNDPLQLLPLYNSGDNLHPNAIGYQKMANTIDLNLFKSCSCDKCKSLKYHELRETHDVKFEKQSIFHFHN